ncbi:hypothetical protein [Subtercola boreus]|uniref:Glycosyltransferase RgtA/B/C/D-like domain-containing protein n=1 Tax=Subtercola boreus TaxID=120213 RepID=A0A3E0WE54_9MICO|nr:hypothetical protein [Subtercola boreus]RFA22640.1 hypothetical protein B7R24_03220 [Subtercola boreus]RFA22996.1 hypothetical protein B7R23_03215 [Subtercola boreus]RFA28747.1 hypothetical protein B7R25_03230 [Subtercola boreus]
MGRHNDTPRWNISTVLFWGLFALGFAYRVLLLFTTDYAINSDNAVVLLIAKQFSEGRVSLFFWGQNYGGTLVSLVAGALMVPFGYHPEVLAITSIAFFAVVTLLVRSIATHAFGRPAGDVAGILSWFSGVWVMLLSISELGFYGPSLALGLGTIWLALRGERQKSYLQWALIGLVAGLALWQSPAGIALAAPGVIALLIRDARPLRWLVGVAAAALGALPWLWLFATADSPLKPQSTGSGIHWESFVTVFTEVVPAEFSVTSHLLRVTIGVLAVALLVLLVVSAVTRRSWWLGTLAASSVFVIVVTVVGPAVVLRADSVRYTAFLVPYLAVMLGWLVTRVRFAGWAAMVLAATATITQTIVTEPAGPFEFQTRDRYIVGPIEDLGDYLESANVSAAYADYWISFSLAAATAERVTAGPIPNSAPTRFEPYQLAAAAASKTTFVVILGHENDTMLQAQAALPAHTRTEVANYYAVYTFDAPFDPQGLSWQVY